MKATIAMVAIFMLTLLVGCNEQSPVSGPQTTAGNTTMQLGKIGYDVSIDQIVVGPTGVKYGVTGTIAYKFEMKGNEYVLETFVNLKVNQSGTENTWDVVGGKGFSSSFNQKWEDAVSEQVGFQFGKFKLPAHSLLIDYCVTPAGVSIKKLQILDGANMISTLD